MRTGRNANHHIHIASFSLDHWDMRTGRNMAVTLRTPSGSLDHWDMRTGRNCGHRQEKQRHFPLTLTVSFCDEWGRLLARLTRPVFAQFADDGQRCVVVQVKREWIGLVLLGCGFRGHVHWVRALRLEERVRCRWCAGPRKRTKAA